MAWVGRTPVGFVILIWKSKRRWVGFQWGGDIRRVYEVMLRRGVPRNTIAAALVRAAPAEARAHKLD
ncbi:MAG: hypothetical protein QME55_02845 [Brevundimonas sp.]|uniref:hypothetical protein n=1 Tax=Brevundimonas sp. TaxID=1871086 RepID=UPI0027FE0556|nr:hypothetical protein [Brevundimonas sp.]MDI6623643.1 hypothetical protein [Brevundimonas sp.]MDQ7812808.1 hypothetical protein [Brevundimonas sp.]